MQNATLIDECGDEFGASTGHRRRSGKRLGNFRETYPESRLIFVEPVNGASTSKAQAQGSLAGEMG
jgi:hypothetical protein